MSGPNVTRALARKANRDAYNARWARLAAETAATDWTPQEAAQAGRELAQAIAQHEAAKTAQPQLPLGDSNDGR